MARRRKESPAEEWIALFALLPWWVCVGLAVASFIACHWVASQPPPAPVAGIPAMQQMGSMMTRSIWQGLALVGQYLLPTLFVLSAIASAWRRRTRKKLMEQATTGQHASAIDGMTWQEFELLIGEGFRRRGFLVAETGTGGPDGGVDLVLRRPATNGAEVFLVQCKHWRAYKVGVDVIRAHYGVMAARGAAGGFVITSGQFTQEARQFAEGRNIELMDGAALKPWLIKRSGTPALDSNAGAGKVDQPAVQVQPATSEPACPLCGQSMVRRVAKRGTNAGQAFWGCHTYPACRGTRQILAP